MEITKEEMALFIEFKKFMSLQGSTKPTKEVKHRREKGTGSVIKLSGKRKRPYLASVTLGYEKYEGKQIQKPLAYFSDRKQANRALDLYILEMSGKCAAGTTLEYIYSVDGSLPREKINIINQNVDKIKAPIGMSNCPTFEEIWKKLLVNDMADLSYSTLSCYKTAFKKLKPIHKLSIDKITLHDIQPCFNDQMEVGSGISKLNNMKNVISKVFKYAIKYDYCDKDYSSYITMKDTSTKEKNTTQPFTMDEIKTLIEDGSYEAKVILIFIFTGMRPQELINITIDDIHLDEKYLVGGMKTKNGMNRIIPLHNLVIPYFKEIIEKNHDQKYFLFNSNKITGTAKYREEIFYPIVKKHGLKHIPYDTRHTFATICKLQGVSDFARKRIMGHSCNDLTDDVYTHSPLDYLLQEVNKLKV